MLRFAARAPCLRAPVTSTLGVTALRCRVVQLREMTENDTVTLFRPTGPEELALLERADFRAWPPRLPDQPIFYPVTNEEYAVQIARDWNVPASGYGCVTRFRVRSDFMAQFPVQQVGGGQHTEWWVPAERLPELNANIVGPIEVIRQFGTRPVAQPTPGPTSDA